MVEWLNCWRILVLFTINFNVTKLAIKNIKTKNKHEIDRNCKQIIKQIETQHSIKIKSENHFRYFN